MNKEEKKIITKKGHIQYILNNIGKHFLVRSQPYLTSSQSCCIKTGDA